MMMMMVCIEGESGWSDRYIKGKIKILKNDNKYCVSKYNI